MSITEFSLIEKYFYQKTANRKDVSLGIGDDGALLKVAEGQNLVVTVDTMVEGVHFFKNTKPEDLAWKIIAVNLSDLAAMGAEPAWISLALTLPDSNEEWLQAFSDSFFECAKYYELQLIGGDTTRGHLTVTIQAMGFVPEERALKRSGAKPGDIICVTGNLGDAGMGLAFESGRYQCKSEQNKTTLTKRFNRPVPRVDVGIAIRQIASSAIDISDGLAGDLPHILEASEVGAMIELSKLPISQALMEECGMEQAVQYALSSGEDYELCFTVAEEYLEKLEKALSTSSCQYHQVGRITGGKNIIYTNQGEPVDLQLSGYKHFRSG